MGSGRKRRGSLSKKLDVFCAICRYRRRSLCKVSIYRVHLTQNSPIPRPITRSLSLLSLSYRTALSFPSLTRTKKKNQRRPQERHPLALLMSFPDAPRRLRPRPWRASGLVIENLRLSRLVLCSPPVRTWNPHFRKFATRGVRAVNLSCYLATYPFFLPFLQILQV